jgi:hypothetical protein
MASTQTSLKKKLFLRAAKVLLQMKYPYKVYSVSGTRNGILTLFANHVCIFQGATGRESIDCWSEVAGAPLLFDHYLTTADEGQTFYGFNLVRLVLKGGTWERRFPNSPPKAVDLAKHLFLNVPRIQTRERDLLEQLPSHGVVAEVGVEAGVYSKLIYQWNKPSKLYLIDAWEALPNPWPSYEIQVANYQGVQSYFQNQIDAGTVILKKGESTEILSQFPDQYLAWVYIDSSHLYEHTCRELELAGRKVKPNGYICGHDYSSDAYTRRCGFGVVRAVNEFVQKTDWKFHFISLDHPASFILSRKAG